MLHNEPWSLLWEQPHRQLLLADRAASPPKKSGLAGQPSLIGARVLAVWAVPCGCPLAVPVSCAYL